VHPTGGSRRVFRQFAWLEVGSVKMALPHPTHQRVTQTVRRFFRDRFSVLLNLSFLKMGSPFYGLKTKRRLTCGSSRNSLAQKNLLFPRQAKAFLG
jgi:hypothetical protein